MREAFYTVQGTGLGFIPPKVLITVTATCSLLSLKALSFGKSQSVGFVDPRTCWCTAVF